MNMTQDSPTMKTAALATSLRRVSGADIAAFLVGQLTDERYRRAAPVISN